MNVQILSANFDAANDQVWVRGNVLGWDAPPSGFQLTEDTSRPGVYTNTYTIDNQLTGDQFQYKCTIWRPATFATVWEGGNNKILVWDGTEPTNAAGYHLRLLPVTYFDGVTPNDVLSVDTLVTFRVNMNGARTYPAGNPFDTNTQSVYINGGFLGWWDWKATPPVAYKLVDDGTSGDSVAGDLIFTWQHLFPKASPVRVQYKYGIDDGMFNADNEAAAYQDHVSYIRAAGSYTMPLDVFGVQAVEPPVVSFVIGSGSSGSVTLTWSGRPGVRLQSADSLDKPMWQDVADTDGQSSKTLPANGAAQFFRLLATP
jgi:hypothetical protein